MNSACTKNRLAVKIFTVLALGTAGFEVYADLTGYLTDQNGAVVKSDTGRCLHSSNWSPDLAVAECDPDRMSQHTAGTAADAIAMPSSKVASNPSGQSVSTLASATVSSKATEKIILAEDALFEYDKSIIKHSGKTTLDNIVNGLADKNEVVISTNLSNDSNGSGLRKFNSSSTDPDLVLRRTAALKSYLVTSGIDSNRISIQDRNGEQDASDITVSTDTDTERVEIEIVPGLR